MHDASDPGERAAALSLVERARANGLTHRPGTPPYRLEAAFSTAGLAARGAASLIDAGGAALATLTVDGPRLLVGSASVTAGYSGDSNFNSSTGSAAVAVAPGPVGSFVSVNISPNPAHAGQFHQSVSHRGSRGRQHHHRLDH